MVLTLERNAAGANNWDDLAVGQGTPSEAIRVVARAVETRDAGSVAAGLAARIGGGIRLESVDLHWRDARAGDLLDLTGLRLRISDIGPDQTMAVHAESDLTWLRHRVSGHAALSFRFSGAAADGARIDKGDLSAHLRLAGHPLREVDLHLRSDLIVALADGSSRSDGTDLKARLWTDNPHLREIGLAIGGDITLEKAVSLARMATGAVTLEVKGDTLPPAGVVVAMRTGMELDLARESVVLEGFEADGPAGTRITGGLRGGDLLHAPGVSGRVDLAPFDPRALLVALGRALPTTADAQALTLARLITDFKVDSDGVTLSGLEMTLDDTRLGGDLQLSSLSPPVGRVDLNADTLDLNRYLPPGLLDGTAVGAMPDGGWSPQAHATAIRALVIPEAGLVQLPPEWLRTWNLEGGIRLDSLGLADVRTGAFALAFRVGGGEIHLQPAAVALYGGELYTTARLRRRETGEAVLDVTKEINGVQSGELLADLAGVHWFSGLGSGRLEVHAAGDDLPSMLETANGSLNVAVADGKVTGLDVVGRIRASYAAIKGGAPDVKVERPRETAFTRLTASAVLEKGVLNNSDLLAVSPTLRVTGGGTVDFVQRNLDYSLVADVPVSLDNLGPERAARLKGLTLPMRMQGPFAQLTAPTIDNVDFSRMLHSAIDTPMLEKAVDRFGGRQRVLDRLERFQRKLERSGGKGAVNDILKDLLGY